MIKLFNTLSKKVEVFKPIDDVVKIYCCGVTVYDLCHLGHARSYIAWDVLRRFLIYSDFKVKYVQNFTDIDDKILKRAKEESSSMKEVSEKNIIEFHKDMDSLGIMRPDSMPRATNHICNICSFITILEDKGYAYSRDGDVYYSVFKNKNYGKLVIKIYKNKVSISKEECLMKKIIKNLIRKILRYGKKPKMMNHFLIRHGVKVGQDGILNVRRWLKIN